MPDAWYAGLYWFIIALYFGRISIVHPERLPACGAVLYLSLHRNGAVDGFLCHCALRSPVFLISSQFLKNWFVRLFFHGIAVTRIKDEGNRSQNDASLGQCLAHLRQGGALCVFPEGTSSLGPRHLGFKSGAVRLILDYRSADGPPLTVVPLGIHYECPWGFRSKVEIVVGAPIATSLPASASPLQQIKEMKRRVQAALEQVGINVVSNEYQVMIQRLAYVATLATPRSYFKALKALEQSVPENILAAWKELEPELRRCCLLYHQGVPLFPMGSTALYVLALLACGPLVLAAIAVNLPPFVAGLWAGQKFPDDRNVISLWKVLVGVPVFVLWIAAVTLATVCLGKLPWLAGYALVTWLGVVLYYRVKKLAVAVHNGVRHPRLRRRMLAFRETVLEALPNETD
jgi:1-acyl-sn-glycerol-3-phosphate acyltransferase